MASQEPNVKDVALFYMLRRFPQFSNTVFDTRVSDFKKSTISRFGDPTEKPLKKAIKKYAKCLCRIRAVHQVTQPIILQTAPEGLSYLDTWKEMRIQALAQIFKNGTVSPLALVQLMEFTFAKIIEILHECNNSLAVAAFQWLVLCLKRAPVEAAGGTICDWLNSKGGWREIDDKCMKAFVTLKEKEKLFVPKQPTSQQQPIAPASKETSNQPQKRKATDTQKQPLAPAISQSFPPPEAQRQIRMQQQPILPRYQQTGFQQQVPGQVNIPRPATLPQTYPQQLPQMPMEMQQPPTFPGYQQTGFQQQVPGQANIQQEIMFRQNFPQQQQQQIPGFQQARFQQQMLEQANMPQQAMLPQTFAQQQPQVPMGMQQPQEIPEYQRTGSRQQVPRRIERSAPATFPQNLPYQRPQLPMGTQQEPMLPGYQQVGFQQQMPAQANVPQRQQQLQIPAEMQRQYVLQGYQQTGFQQQMQAQDNVPPQQQQPQMPAEMQRQFALQGYQQTGFQQQMQVQDTVPQQQPQIPTEMHQQYTIPGYQQTGFQQQSQAQGNVPPQQQQPQIPMEMQQQYASQGYQQTGFQEQTQAQGDVQKTAELPSFGQTFQQQQTQRPQSLSETQMAQDTDQMEPPQMGSGSQTQPCFMEDELEGFDVNTALQLIEENLVFEASREGSATAQDQFSSLEQPHRESTSKVQCGACGKLFDERLGILRGRCDCGRHVCLKPNCNFSCETQRELRNHIFNVHFYNAEKNECAHCGSQKDRTVSMCMFCMVNWCTIGECRYETHSADDMKLHERDCQGQRQKR